MLATEHDRSKEYKSELEKLRSDMQRRMFAHQPMPMPIPMSMPMGHYHFMRPPVISSAAAAVEPLEFEGGFNPAVEPEFDSHYAAMEHPTKRMARDVDLRETLSSKPPVQTCKRLCYHGERCKYLRKNCDFAHAIDELQVCPSGLKCKAKMRCGYMLHSKDDR